MFKNSGLVLAFDFALGLLAIIELVSLAAKTNAHGESSQYQAAWNALNILHDGLNALTIISVLVTSFFLVRRRWPAAVRCQRFLFLLLLVQLIGFLAALSLPTEGGVGGIGVLFTLPIYISLPVIAFRTARFVRGLCNGEPGV